MKKVESKKVAIALVNKMISYEQKIDAKKNKSEAESRHIAFLRALKNFNK